MTSDKIYCSPGRAEFLKVLGACADRETRCRYGPPLKRGGCRGIVISGARAFRDAEHLLSRVRGLYWYPKYPLYLKPQHHRFSFQPHLPHLFHAALNFIFQCNDFRRSRAAAIHDRQRVPA